MKERPEDMLTIRAAQPRDYAIFERLRRELGLDEPVPSAVWFETYALAGTRIAEREGEVAGLVFYELFADVCYVRLLVTDPSTGARGSGARSSPTSRARRAKGERAAGASTSSPTTSPRSRSTRAWGWSSCARERRFERRGRSRTPCSRRARAKLFSVRREGTVVALAGFEPLFQGAFVFRAGDLGAARAAHRDEP